MRNKIEESFKEGLRYIEKDEYNNAIDCLNKAVEIDPDFFEAWFRLGVAYFYKQDYENALICNLKAWVIRPDSSIEYDVFQCYNKLVELNSKNLNVWRKTGDFLFKRGVYKKALECYDRTIDIVRLSNSSFKLNEIFIKKGQIFYDMGELDSAINSYDKALEVDRTDEIAIKYKMKLLKEINKKKRCSECGAPLKLKVGQLIGDRMYVIVDVEHLRFLMGKINGNIDSGSSYELQKFRKIEENYKKIELNARY